MNTFKPEEIVVIKKGLGGVVFIRILSEFKSKIKCTRNPSGVSYNIQGYEVRNWCFSEEIRKTNIFDKILYHFIKERIDKKFS